ncbi:MAG: hypothetical protein H6739_25170 [Alphaproteobacteria bacterium]|nr:hypothetical protein [Alphaproteobacteria bacterium]
MSNKPLVLVFLAIACGPKEPTSTAAAAEGTEEAAPAEVSSDAVPGDKNSQEFAQKLLALKITDFRPIDSDGAEFIYNTLTFSPDGTWAATGAVSIMDETMECRESGDWSMDAAESADTAAVGWTVAETNCAGRESGAEQRILLTIKKGGEYEVSFR